MQTHSYNSSSWVCILHFSLKIPNSLYTSRRGRASHRALFIFEKKCLLHLPGNAELGEEQGFGEDLLGWISGAV